MLYKKSLYDEGKEKKMTEKALESYMDTVEEIRQIPINDIYADLTGHSVHMRAKVCCIVHNDHDPSMGFARGNDGYFYHCFSCGASGDAVKMTMILRGIRWTEAVRYLANRYNIPIRQDFREQSDPFPFTRDHMEFLGLMPGISCGSCIRGCVPSKDIDVIMVAPKGSGTSLRTMFLEGRGLNSSYAVYNDATGKALDRTLALGIGIGSGYLFETTFQREATSDLTGERGSLMGAIQGLLLAQYEVLRENGHTPSEAFNETVEELTQSLMPLFAEKGMDWMYANCSTTAQRGALDWYPRFHDAIKPVVQQLYESVKSGNEAQISIDANSKPDYRVGLEKELAALHDSEMWRTAETVRQLRPENN